MTVSVDTALTQTKTKNRKQLKNDYLRFAVPRTKPQLVPGINYISRILIIFNHIGLYFHNVECRFLLLCLLCSCRVLVTRSFRRSG